MTGPRAVARGRGVATTAVRAVAASALDDLGRFRLELGHRTNNPASCRVATAAGFPVEGLERAKLGYGGERFDVELHARLATDPARSGGAWRHRQPRQTSSDQRTNRIVGTNPAFS